MGFQKILNDTSESNISKFKKLSAILLLGACILIFLGLSVYCGLILINRENRQNQITSKSNRNYNSTENLASDNVKLIKVSNFKLHDDDLLYESLRNLNTFNINNKSRGSVISATDTFRSKSNQIWDPHPEYILKAFGHQLHLVLHQDNSFIATDTFKIINIPNDHSEEEIKTEGHYLDCYYKGYVKGDSQSSVAVSLCNGMTGYIKSHLHGPLLIQPLYNAMDYVFDNASTSSEIFHKIWRNSKQQDRHEVIGSKESLLPKLKRMKRDIGSKSLTIELLIAVDRTMIKFHKTDTKSYILTLISILSNLYSEASLGNDIQISVANIIVLKDFKTSRYSTDSETLQEFCAQVQKGGYHYDAAIFLTRNPLCGNQCSAIGLASMATACKRNACALVKDNGLQAAFTMAHELGHILSMPHDDHKSCEPFNKPGVEEKLHLMNFQSSYNIQSTWSDCSRHHLTEYLEQENVTCLEDTPTKFIPYHNNRLPGEIYSLEEQCKMIHGNKSRGHCKNKLGCKSLFCKTSETDLYCFSNNLPWADGTPCKGNHFWCQKGECIPRQGYVREVINGGWNSWGSWSQCSLTCGGGIQKSIRECNNPLPQNGGRYCRGIGKKYRSCNIQNCPSDSMNIREKQCYEMNRKDFQIKGIGSHVKWIPKYGMLGNDRCNLYCLAEGGKHYFRLPDKVIDGTPCSYESFDKCVNGVCQTAGCDNVLNSTAKLDQCGVCNGHNDTCENVFRNFKVSDLFKAEPQFKNNYFHVTTIPRGASNIVIKKIHFPDENYIALRDDQNNWFLNGNFLLTGQADTIFHAGVAYKYSGSRDRKEKVYTTIGSKLKRPLNVDIISYSKSMNRDKDTILLSYSYTRNKINCNKKQSSQRKPSRILFPN